MNDFYRAEPKALQADARAVALKEWKLLDEEHCSVYQERAAGDLLHQAHKSILCATPPAGLQRNYIH